MKHNRVDIEPPYLRKQREAIAHPGVNLLAGLLLSAASVFGMALIVPQSGFDDTAYAARDLAISSATAGELTLCIGFDPSRKGRITQLRV